MHGWATGRDHADTIIGLTFLHFSIFGGAFYFLIQLSFGTLFTTVPFPVLNIHVLLPTEREATPDINIEDYDNALEGFTPAALRGVTLHTAGELGWSDVGGLASVKDALMETLLWPTKVLSNNDIQCITVFLHNWHWMEPNTKVSGQFVHFTVLSIWVECASPRPMNSYHVPHFSKQYVVLCIPQNVP